jgi:hypothetical protein
LMDAVGVVRIGGRPRVRRADLVRYLEQTRGKEVLQ